MSEVAPVEISGTLGTLNQFNAVAGILVANSLSFLVPYPQNFEAGTLTIWRLLFAFPALIALLQLLLLIFVFKLDTPKYYKNIDDLTSHREIMSKIYTTNRSDASLIGTAPVDITDKAPLNGSNQHKNENEKSLSDLFSPRFRMALFVGVCLSAFHQLTGANGIIFHSNDLFTEGKTGISASKAAKIGTFFIGVSSFTGTFICLMVIKYIGRKTLMLVGVFLMMFNLSYLGFSSMYGWTIQQIIGANTFLILYNATLAPGLWIYAAEILPPKGMSICAFVNMGMTAIFGTFSNIFFKVMTAQGFFFTLSAIQVVCLAFIAFFVKETMGKSKEE